VPDDPTATVPAPDHVVVEGRRVDLPVRVDDAAQVSATWRVDAREAQTIVGPTGLEVVADRRGRATVSVAAVDYRRNDLGAYHEIALAFVVVPHDAPPGWRPDPRRPTTYIHRLPVDEDFTCAAGRQIWGFPKWVTDLSWRQTPRGTDAVLVEDGRFVLGLHVDRGWVPLPARALPMSCYTFLDGTLRRTEWTTTLHGGRLRPGGARVAVGTGHPLAYELDRLGIHGRRPLIAISAPRITATFGPPEVVDA
jgi:hypothetical protein